MGKLTFSKIKKSKRTCKNCKQPQHLTSIQLSKWRGFCSLKCRKDYYFNDKSWLHKQCDIEFSKIIREKGYCEWCGRSEIKLDCAHIIPRGNMTLRFDPMNALSLDHVCHRFRAHANPLEFTEWFKNKYPSRFVYLMKFKNIVTKRTVEDYQILYKRLLDKDIKHLMISLKN